MQTLTQPNVLLAGITVAGIVAGPKIAGLVDSVRGQPRSDNGFGEMRETKVRRAYIYIGMATLIAVFLFLWSSV